MDENGGTDAERWGARSIHPPTECTKLALYSIKIQLETPQVAMILTFRLNIRRYRISLKIGSSFKTF